MASTLKSEGATRGEFNDVRGNAVTLGHGDG